MEKNRPNIDQLIQSSFDAFEPQLPIGIWNNIEDKLNQNDASKRKKVLTWSSVAAVVFIGLSGMFYSNIPDNATVDHKTGIKISNTELKSGSFENKLSQSLPIGNGNSDLDLNDVDLNNSLDNKDVKTTGKKLVVENNRNITEIASINKNSVVPNLFDINQEPILTQENYENMNEANFDFLNSKKLGLINTKILQLPASSQIPQRPTKQKRSIWAFEVGYDQNQTAINYAVNTQLSKYVHKNFVNRIKEGEFALAAPQLHAALRYQFNPNWSVAIGLGFSQTRISQSFNFQDSTPVSMAQGNEADINGNYPIFGYVGLGMPVAYNGNQSISMVSIPLSVGYQRPINRSWAFSSEISMRFNKLLTTTGKTLDYHDLSLMDVPNYRSQIWSAKLSIGAEKRVSLRDIWGVRLNTQGALTPFNSVNSPVSNRGWSIGMSVFYRYSIW